MIEQNYLNWVENVGCSNSVLLYLKSFLIFQLHLLIYVCVYVHITACV